MIGQLLAETAAAAGNSDMNYVTTGAIGLVMSAIVGVITYSKGRQRRSVTIDKQPVGVDIADKYVTRTEFAEFKGEMKAEVKEMKGLFDKAVTLIAERDERLSDKISSQGDQLTEMINKVASGAYEARRRIHETINDQGQKLAVLSERSDISKSMGKLGGAIMATVKEKQKG